VRSSCEAIANSSSRRSTSCSTRLEQSAVETYRQALEKVSDAP
jgi:hypothetical protein